MLLTSQDGSIASGSEMNGSDCVERDSPPPGTFPRTLATSRQQKEKQSSPYHGVFIPATDEARHVFIAVLSATDNFGFSRNWL